jgi:transposase InsO family protein
MTRLTPELRLQLGKLARADIPKKVLVGSFCVSRTSVWFWGKQNLHYISDLPRKKNFKISVETEITIIAFRNNFGYGCARIQQRLFCAPDFELEQMEVKVQGVQLSRQAINEILRKWGISGYKKKRSKAWKFFRALYANELWQVDLKEFKFQDKKYYLLVCIDDYSRYILCLHLFDHCPTTKDLTFSLEKLNIKPEKILFDNGGQFQNQWKAWCISKGIEPKAAHPYYPQDKGKVERTIRNITEELICHLSHFSMFFDKFEEYRDWFNKKRYHRGVKDYPANIYLI